MGSTTLARRAGSQQATNATDNSAIDKAEKCKRVGRADAVEQRGHQARQADRRGDAEDDAGGDQGHALSQNEAQDIAALRAERDADAELARPLRDGIRNDAIQSDRGQEQRGAGEDAEEQHREFFLEQRSRDHVVHRPRIAERHRFVHVPDGLLHRGQQRQRIFRRGPDSDVHQRPHSLAERLVKFRAGRGFEGKMADIAHHAHDLKLFVFRSVIFDVLADRIFAGENVLRASASLMIATQRRAFRVVLGEVAAAHERNAHRLEIIRRRDADIGLVLLRAAGAIEGARAVAARERQPADRRDALHPWHSRHASHDLLIELELAIFVGSRGSADSEDEEPIGIESGSYFRQVREALDHQPGADQQDQRQAHFSGDEERAPPAPAAGASAFALFQGVRRVPGRRRKRRDEPEQNAGDNRHAETEREDLAIEADLLEVLQAREAPSTSRAGSPTRPATHPAHRRRSRAARFR